MDHYADDLATVVDALALKDISMFGFSTGGGEVARYVARHGTSRVAKLGLISAVTPIMLRTPDHPAGVPIEVFDGIRADMVAERDRTSVVEGKSVSVRVDHGCRRNIKKKKKT